jgi:beta-N-acetylhexosaminidase
MTLSLEHQIGQLLMVGFSGTTAPDYLLDWIAAGRVGGVILFARNVRDAEQLAELTRALHRAAPTPLLIAIDQEGGKVARLRHANGFTESPGAMNLSAATGETGVRHSREMSGRLAAEMRHVGINWTFAPVVDLTYNAENPTVGTRSYGDTHERVSAMAAAAVEGFQSEGVAACAKHFPGLGNTAIDSHLALPRLEGVSVDDLLASDLVPYQRTIAAGLASVMTTHTLFPALDEQHPATLSEHIVETLLRRELGYDGVVVTDCLEMKAIADHYTPAQSALMSIGAGVDIALFSHTPEMQTKAYDALLKAAQSGELPAERIGEANRRIAALKAAYAIDPNAISADGLRDDASVSRSVAIARDGIVTVKRPPTMPRLNRRLGLVEFIPYQSSEVMETAGETQLAALLGGVQTVHVHSVHPTPPQRDAAMSLMHASDVLIVATRNAHVLPEQHELAAALTAAHPNAILVALRNPYDAGTLHAETVLCTCGDSHPALVALADVLRDGDAPTGTLPVPLEVGS